MGTYRKKPVSVDAWQIPSTLDPLWPPPSWVLDGFLKNKIVPQAGSAHVMEITTNHGPAIAGPTDWILRDHSTGELYPCENLTFERNYEQETSDTGGCRSEHTPRLQQDAGVSTEEQGADQRKDEGRPDSAGC